MGENRETPNSIRRLSTIKQYRLSDAMIGALETGMPSNGTANVIGRSGTLVALIERGLITTGRTHQWTMLGYDVAARVLSGRVPAYRDGHPLNTQLGLSDEPEPGEPAADPRQWATEGTEYPYRGEPGAGRYRSKSCCATTEGDVHARDCQTPAARKQWGPMALRTQADRTPEAAPTGSAHGAPDLRIDSGDLVTVDGADTRVWRVERVADFGDDETGREPWAELVHVAGTRTSIPVKRLTHATAAEILGAKRAEAELEVKSAPFAAGDRVTIPTRDNREWTIAEIVPGDPTSESRALYMPWASLTRQESRTETVATTATLDRLAPVATSQPATSQITMSGDAEQVLAGIAELIRGVRAADPEFARTIARTQYDTLRAFLRMLSGTVEVARENCSAMGHGGRDRHDDGRACGEAFDVADIRDMVNATARELGIRTPWAGGQ